MRLGMSACRSLPSSGVGSPPPPPSPLGSVLHLRSINEMIKCGWVNTEHFKFLFGNNVKLAKIRISQRILVYPLSRFTYSKHFTLFALSCAPSPPPTHTRIIFFLKDLRTSYVCHGPLSLNASVCIPDRE